MALPARTEEEWRSRVASLRLVSRQVHVYAPVWRTRLIRLCDVASCLDGQACVKNVFQRGKVALQGYTVVFGVRSTCVRGYVRERARVRACVVSWCVRLRVVAASACDTLQCYRVPRAAVPLCGPSCLAVVESSV